VATTGLNTVVPFTTDPAYYQLRLSMSCIKPEEVLSAHFAGLHRPSNLCCPCLSKVVGVVQGVGYPRPNLSFRSIESGKPHRVH
jgi:hypothetical protein